MFLPCFGLYGGVGVVGLVVCFQRLGVCACIMLCVVECAVLPMISSKTDVFI